MNLLNKTKPIYLLILLVIIVVPLILLLLVLFKSSPETPAPSISPTITLAPVRTRKTAAPTLPAGTLELRIIRAGPTQNPQVAYLPIQPFELTFTYSILPQELKYSVDPHVETTVRQGSISTSLIISPVKRWQDGETLITILPTTVTTSGARMLTPYIYRMISAFPPVPNEGNY